jgi:hypothetical protein
LATGNRDAKLAFSRGTKRCDEQLAGMYLAGRRVKNVDRRAGIIDEQRLAGHVRLPHRRRQAAFPGTIEFAEPAAALTIGMGGPVFLPHQLQRHALAAQLAMDRRQTVKAAKFLKGLVVCAVICEPVSPEHGRGTGNILKNSAKNRVPAG